MRVLLFDWWAGGHHRRYMERAAEALAPHATVIAAAPGETLDGVEAGVERHALAQARPALDESRARRPQLAALARTELDLLDEAIGHQRPDAALHLYADPIIRRLARRPRLPCRLSLLVFYPRAHYRKAFGSSLGPEERLRALYLERLVRRFARRAEAGSILTLDEEAARGWAASGLRAGWLPEPPIGVRHLPSRDRSFDLVVYGALAERKGVGALAAAVAAHPSSLRVLLAGPVEPGFRQDLERAIAAMRDAGAEVELRDRTHSEAEGLDVLAQSRVAVLPYPRHYGMSRVLLEAAAVSTPVVAHEFGLLGDLVRRGGLGSTANCADPEALRDAIARELDAPDRSTALARFAGRFDASRFEDSLRDAVLTP